MPGMMPHTFNFNAQEIEKAGLWIQIYVYLHNQIQISHRNIVQCELGERQTLKP